MAADLCSFDEHYRGVCKQPAPCPQHASLTCRVCGAPATWACDYEGRFVCGTPLCRGCERFEDKSMESGSWGFLNHGHKRKPDVQ